MAELNQREDFTGIIKKQSIVLFGAGKYGKTLLGLINKDDYASITVVDNNKQLWGDCVLGYTIEKPFTPGEEVLWCVTIRDRVTRAAIERQCIDELGFNDEKEVSYNDLVRCSYLNIFTSIGEQLKTDEKKIIIDFLPGFVLGGIEAWTIGLIEELSKKNEWIPLVISKKDDNKAPMSISRFVIYVDKENDLKFQPDFMNAVAKELISNKPGNVIISRPNELLLTACLAKESILPNMRIHVVIHGGTDENYDIYNYYWQAFRNIDSFVAVSDDIVMGLKDRGVPEDRLFSITCPFACEKNLERGYSVEPSTPIRIGYAGRLDGFERSQKRMDLLLKVCCKLRKSGIAYKMEIAGDGPAKGKMIEYSKENNLTENICFWGEISRSEIGGFWEKQDIAINVADYEGRSISKLEAMANGAIPIMTDTSGTKQDIDEGENGFVVPLGDVDAIVKQIRYLNDNRELLPIMGKKAHDRVYPLSSIENHVAFWEALFKGKKESDERVGRSI